MTNSLWLKLIKDRRQNDPVTPPADANLCLPQISGIKAVVFDVYGTLFSSGVGDISLATEDNRDTAIRAVLSDNGVQILASAEGIRFDGILHDLIHQHQNRRRADGIEYPEVEIRAVWSDLIESLRAQGLIEAQIEPAIDTLVIDYETRVNAIQPMPELAEVLSELRARGLTLSIISNAQFYTPLLFSAFLGKNIDELGFCSKCNVWSYAELEGKPSQQLYQLAAERLEKHHRIPAEACLYVGNDMRNDIWPARALGFRTALFAGDHLSLRRRKNHPACAKLQADAEITELKQILEMID
ncbi:HAD family hydrolase [Coraliomargarita sinensis]|uniref:HAD family hydrolase n=1 Tax=Coraliomargarita sinensis TaxID=2174842 RepID=A0A317ZJP3_9BACT|nr:HAD family hydrolase [Coraliomargarita sinensis]PXA04457.1 HAD family hydrolase [Coraliomargarita sinensis]